MAFAQVPLSGDPTSPAIGNTSQQALPYDSGRQFLYIRNYSSSTVPIYVAFGPDLGGAATATVGQNGEIEVLPGEDFVFGGNFPTGVPANYKPNCPRGTVNVIAQSGTCLGCIVSI